MQLGSRRGRPRPPGASSAAPDAQAADSAAFTWSARMPGNDRAASEAAIGGQSEFRQVLAGQCHALAESLHIVDRAEINARAARVELLEWREESPVLGVQQRDVDPAPPPARCL